MIARLPLLLLVCAASVAHANPGTTAQDSTAEASTAGSSRPDPDDKRRIVGILEVRVEGVPKEIQRQFQSDLENQLDSREYWLAGEQRMRELMANSTKWTEGCFVGKCLTEVKTQTGADLVLLASITGAGTSFGYVVTLMRTDTGNVLAQEASRCEVCTVNEVLASATLAAVKLLTAVPDKLPDEAAEQSAALDLATKNLRAEVRHAEGHSRAVGIALTLAGVVAAGAGMTAYLAMDKPTSALAGAGVGAGLALSGVVVLTF